MYGSEELPKLLASDEERREALLKTLNAITLDSLCDLIAFHLLQIVHEGIDENAWRLLLSTLRHTTDPQRRFVASWDRGVPNARLAEHIRNHRQRLLVHLEGLQSEESRKSLIVGYGHGRLLLDIDKIESDSRCAK